jgi:putative transposase
LRLIPLKSICLEISTRYEIHFLEIGCDDDHVHFLIQSVPMLSPKKIVNTVKSLTAREIFRLHPEVKRFLWGGKFWTSGYYINTVGQYANEEVIMKYVQGQGNDKKYQKIHKAQLRLF